MGAPVAQSAKSGLHGEGQRRGAPAERDTEAAPQTLSHSANTEGALLRAGPGGDLVLEPVRLQPFLSPEK